MTIKKVNVEKYQEIARLMCKAAREAGFSHDY